MWGQAMSRSNPHTNLVAHEKATDIIKIAKVLLISTCKCVTPARVNSDTRCFQWNIFQHNSLSVYF